MATDSDNGGTPRTANELKKLMLKKTLCAKCPNGQFEAVTIEGYGSEQERAKTIMTPIDQLKNRWHVCVYCAAKGRYIPAYMELCEAYEQAKMEQSATTLDQRRARA